MSRLSQIAVRVEAPGVATPRVATPGVAIPDVATPARRGGLGGGVAAVLCELVGMLERVALAGNTDMIDLRSLPMSPDDRRELQATLGQGEVHATLSADGISTLQETALCGVWWVEHRDRQGDLIAELIEVAAVPKILAASTEEMTASARELRARMKHATSA